MAGHIGSTVSTDWCTPPHIIAAVEVTLGGRIDLDPCSNASSIVGSTYSYSLPDVDGLTSSWSAGPDGPTISTVYVNPPYGCDAARGTTIKNWIQRCSHYASEGLEIVAVVPAAVDTSYWQHTIFASATRICFLEGRLKFFLEGKDASAPNATAAIYWGRYPQRFELAFGVLGTVLTPPPVLVAQLPPSNTTTVPRERWNRYLDQSWRGSPQARSDGKRLTKQSYPITLSTLIKRINRRLRDEGEIVKRPRGERARQELGEFYIVTIHSNTVEAQHVEIENLGAHLGVLKAGQEVIW